MNESQLHPNAARVQAALEAAGSSSRVLELDGSTRTADEAAATLGVEVAQIVKSLVFVADGEPVLMLVPGDRRVDTAKAQSFLEADHFERADADMVREATGFPIGGVPPVRSAARRRLWWASSEGGSAVSCEIVGGAFTLRVKVALTP